MATTSLTHTDLEVREGVLQQLAWDSEVDASGIGVTVHEGAVTLTGFIGSYAGKLAAERSAKRIRGVRAVANDIQVTLRLGRTDADIAADLAHALTVRMAVPESVQATVRSGHVTLTGSAETLLQRSAAEEAIRYVRGIRNVVNRIVVSPATTHDVHREIVAALHRDASVHARGITVTVDDDMVTLTGRVRTWHERDTAEHAASHAAGVRRVDNRLSVVWPSPGDQDADPERR